MGEAIWLRSPSAFCHVFPSVVYQHAPLAGQRSSAVFVSPVVSVAFTAYWEEPSGLLTILVSFTTLPACEPSALVTTACLPAPLKKAL